MFEFKSYSWVIGTTSFRVKEINYKIEQQLFTLKELFGEYPNEKWQTLQEVYYDMLFEKNLIIGNAQRKDKDAREKTSGLKELGLITEDRHLTEVGEEILRLVKDDEIDQSNDFMIDLDAFVYLKQLLKLYVRDPEFKIRPFVALLYLLDKLGYLTEDEFTYLLPLCKNKEDVKRMAGLIEQTRKGNLSFNSIIIKFMRKMPNYRKALDYFLKQEIVTCDLVCEIGMNRKSRKYDAPYYDLFIALKQAAVTETITEIEMNSVLNILKKLKKPSTEWKLLLFGKTKRSSEKLENFKKRMFKLFSSKDESAFRNTFFNILHLFKWKANLVEYADLNKRYFSLADILLFQDGKVELTLFSKYFFHLCIDELLEEKIVPSLLPRNLALKEISTALNIKTEEVVELVSKETGKLLDIPTMRTYFQKEKEEQLLDLINQKFNPNKLIQLFTWIEGREDKQVQEYVTDNADIPTIFEYLLGISWYHISGESINLMDSWNLSLDANLLPKRHAGGGESDIVIDYPATDFYPQHKLMIEATLTNKTNQRRAEMEPVSRHLGTLKAKHANQEVYAVFVSNHLDRNVIVDLRSRKAVPFHDRVTDTWIENNKIIPLNTKNIKMILEKKIQYWRMYKFFSVAYEKEIPYQDWYEKTINLPLQKYV